jgi:hypothetical protein
MENIAQPEPVTFFEKQLDPELSGQVPDMRECSAKEGVGGS